MHIANLLRRFGALLLAPILCAIASAAGSVRIAERPLVGPFATLQAAVDAALEGESLLVTPGIYNSFTIDGKSIQVFVTGTGQATILGGRVLIKNLGPNQFATLSRLNVKGIFLSPTFLAALEIDSVDGHVRLQDSTFEGAGGSPDVGLTGGGVVLKSAGRVVFSNCSIKGGVAGFVSGKSPIDGGVGLESDNSAVALYDCTVEGGRGSEESFPRGGHGGHAYVCTNYGLFAAGTAFKGGRAGGGDFIGCTVGGIGADALRVDSGQARLLANTYTAGLGGWSSCGPPSASGQTIVALNGSLIDQLSGASRKLTAPRITADDTPFPLTISGQPGDRVYLFFGSGPTFMFLKPLNGMWLLPAPLFATRIPAGTIGASGSLVLNSTLGIANGSQAARLFWIQALCIDTTGKPILTGPAHPLSIDAASGPDCNGNGRQDVLDVLFGGLPDCDKNLTPDSCDPDCNGNAIPDACDIAAGTLPDCNGNGIPDSCDVASGTPDCNSNGIPDACDIATNSSPDVNQNGVPDECEAQFLTWHVDASAPAGGNGGQAAPFQTLADGVSAAFHGDTILIADGLYQGAGNRNINLAGRHLTLRSLNGPTNCIIDCESAGRALSMNLNEDVTIEGLGFDRGLIAGFGGAIDAVGGTLTLRDCVFTNCTATQGGGALRISVGSAVLEPCVFLSNASTLTSWGQGGALSVDRSPLRARDCTFAFNNGFRGGAVYLAQAISSNPVAIFTHCNFLENQSNYGGACLVLPVPAGVKHTFDHCQFVGNTSTGDAGAVMSYAPADISSSTFVSNSAAGRGGAIYFRYGAATNLSNSILWGSSAPNGPQIFLGDGGLPKAVLSIAHSDLAGGQFGIGISQGLLTWGAGNLSLDPLFVDADGPDNNPLTFGDNEYALSALSPCVDAGDNGALIADLLDVDGDGDTNELVPLDLRHLPRRVDVISVPDTGAGIAPIVDIGALERPN